MVVYDASLNNKVEFFLIKAAFSYMWDIQTNKQIKKDQISTFIHANCHAENQNPIFIDIKLDKKSGIVLQALCDSGAGMVQEAHCKHLETVL